MIEMKNVDQALGDDLERVSIQLEKATEIELVAKEALKDAKATKESLKSRETELVIEMRSGQQRLDFSDGGDEAWKAVTLLELGITGKEAEILTDAKLTTLGKIAAYTSSGKELTGLAGIGAEKAEAMSQKMENYWAMNPQESGDESLLEWTEEIDDDGFSCTAISQYGGEHEKLEYQITEHTNSNGDVVYMLSCDPDTNDEFSTLDQAKVKADRIESELFNGTEASEENTKGN